VVREIELQTASEEVEIGMSGEKEHNKED
jgi:hypothetical protein